MLGYLPFPRGYGWEQNATQKSLTFIKEINELDGITDRVNVGCVFTDSDNKQIRWPDWFAANGLSAPLTRNMRFDRSFLAISAAANGLGVALESTRLAESEIASGRLVPVLAGKSIDVRYVGHYLVFPSVAVRRQTLRAFTEWLTEGLGLARMERN